MNLKDQYDVVLVGKSYFSTIFATSLQAQGKSTLVIDDPQVKYGPHWSLHFGELERRFLKMWGDTYQIGPLSNIENYLTPRPITLYFQGKQIYLSGVPHQNARELMRKLATVFNLDKSIWPMEKNQTDKFDEFIFYYTERISEMSFKFRTVTNFDQTVFEEVQSVEFQQLFNFFKEKLLAPQSVVEKNFIFLLQFMYHSKFSSDVNEFELYYLLVSLFTPRYEIDEQKLNQDLINLLGEMGGHTKATSVQDWQLHRGRPEHISLSSFEGVVKPNSVYFMGKLNGKIPFKLASSYPVHQGINIVFDFSAEPEPDVFSSMEGQELVFSLPERLGMDYPIWHGQFLSSAKCIIQVPYPKIKGSKAEFHYEKIKSMVIKDLSSCFPRFVGASALRCLKIYEGSDFWPELSLKNMRSGHQKTNLVESTGPLSQKKVSGMTYWGPLRGRSFGPFSFLMDIKYQAYQWKNSENRTQ